MHTQEHIRGIQNIYYNFWHMIWQMHICFYDSQKLTLDNQII